MRWFSALLCSVLRLNIRAHSCHSYTHIMTLTPKMGTITQNYIDDYKAEYLPSHNICDNGKRNAVDIASALDRMNRVQSQVCVSLCFISLESWPIDYQLYEAKPWITCNWLILRYHPCKTTWSYLISSRLRLEYACSVKPISAGNCQLANSMWRPVTAPRVLHLSRYKEAGSISLP